MSRDPRFIDALDRLSSGDEPLDTLLVGDDIDGSVISQMVADRGYAIQIDGGRAYFFAGDAAPDWDDEQKLDADQIATVRRLIDSEAIEVVGRWAP